MESIKRFKDNTGRILIGTTFIKSFNDENACPKQLYHQYILEDARRLPSQSMIMGNYFEALILGSTSKNETAAMIEPFIKKTTKGAKTVDQERIEAQATKWPQFCSIYNISNINPQVEAIKPLDEVVSLGTVLDIHAKVNDPLYGEVDAIIDVKLTKDLDNSFGEYQWKEPAIRDHTQAFMSVYLAKHVLGIKDPKFYYAVFSYGPETDYQLIEKVVTDTDIYELQQTVNKTLEIMSAFHNSDWPTNPSYEKCSKCPLAASCEQKLQIKPIVRI